MVDIYICKYIIYVNGVDGIFGVRLILADTRGSQQTHSYTCPTEKPWMLCLRVFTPEGIGHRYWERKSAYICASNKKTTAGSAVRKGSPNTHPNAFSWHRIMSCRELPMSERMFIYIIFELWACQRTCAAAFAVSYVCECVVWVLCMCMFKFDGLCFMPVPKSSVVVFCTRALQYCRASNVLYCTLCSNCSPFCIMVMVGICFTAFAPECWAANWYAISFEMCSVFDDWIVVLNMLHMHVHMWLVWVVEGLPGICSIR